MLVSRTSYGLGFLVGTTIFITIHKNIEFSLPSKYASSPCVFLIGLLFQGCAEEPFQLAFHALDVEIGAEEVNHLRGEGELLDRLAVVLVVEGQPSTPDGQVHLTPGFLDLDPALLGYVL